MDLAIARHILHNLCDLVIVGVVPVKGPFVPDPQPDHDSHGHAYREAGDIDKRMCFVPLEVADGDLEEVF
jgi:hypothetical protein